MKNHEILEKILRDIMSIELEARKLMNDSLEMQDYNELLRKIKKKEKSESI